MTFFEKLQVLNEYRGEYKYLRARVRTRERIHNGLNADSLRKHANIVADAYNEGKFWWQRKLKRL